MLDLATNHSTDFGPSSVWETAKVRALDFRALILPRDATVCTRHNVFQTAYTWQSPRGADGRR